METTMLRASAFALLLLTTPTYAQELTDIDAALVQLFDRDGPGITHQHESDDVSSEGCSSYDSELPVDDPCSGWILTGYVDFGDGPEPTYTHRDDIEAADEDLDPNCPPERDGSCPELLDPEAFAEWLANNPEYDGPR
jgi:hypothetical protein